MSHPAETPAHDALAEQQDFLRRLARSLVADEHQAEDLAQDSALAALRRPPRAVRSMRSWLARVARNLAANTARAERARSAHELAAPARDAPRTPAEMAARIEAQRAVLAAFERLEEPYKSTLFLRYFDDLAPSEIAARTGVPVSTVKTRLARGLARMRTELDERHGGERGAWAVALMGGFEGWEKTTLGAAAAAGGIGMGAKLAWGVVAVGAALLGAWWATRSPTAPRIGETVVTLPAAEEVAAVAPSAMRETAPEPRLAPVEIPDSRFAVTGETPAWLLELELRGWEAEDRGAVSIAVSRPNEDSPSVVRELPLAEQVEVDVAALFPANGKRPAVLRVQLDHPRYVPLEADVLVPLELQQAEAPGGRLRTALLLERAKAFVTGSVTVGEGRVVERPWVALYAMKGQRPADEPIERVHPDPSGRFKVRADAADVHALVAYGDTDGGHSLAPWFMQSSGLQPETRVLTLEQGEVRELEPIVLGEGATIAGQVAFPAGAEVLAGRIEIALEKHATNPLELIWMDGRFETGKVSAEWDEDGRFEFKGLAPRLYRLVPTMYRAHAEEPTLGVLTSFAKNVSAPALDTRMDFNVVRVAFMVTGGGVPVQALFSATTPLDEPAIAWNGAYTSPEGRIFVVLDPSLGLNCRVDDGIHAKKDVRFLPAELTGGDPIEIALDAPDAQNATLAIHIGARARELASDVILDVQLFDRSHANPMDSLVSGGYSGSGPAEVVFWNGDVQPRMSIEDDRTQVISNLPPTTYSVLLAPRAADPSRPCLLLREELEIELRPGARLDHEWSPKIGGGLRINFVGSGAKRASVCNARGERLHLGFRQGTSVSSAPQIPGANEVIQALAAGTYELRIQLEDGTEHIVPVQVEAGRVNDVEIDLGAL